MIFDHQQLLRMIDIVNQNQFCSFVPVIQYTTLSVIFVFPLYLLVLLEMEWYMNFDLPRVMPQPP